MGNGTNQLAVSQVVDWSTRGLVNLPICFDLKFAVNNPYKCD